jgi:DNA-binding GntR family transcriptional regulator
MGRRAGSAAKLGEGHGTATAAVAAAIRQRILDGRYATGTKLPQDALAAEFGISRIPVREALVQLEAEGLVTLAPQRGASVSALSRARMTETLEMRALLEPHLLQRSAPRLTAADMAALEATLAEYDAAIAGRRVDLWGALNTRFHLLLHARADRPRAQAMVATLLQESDRYTRLQLAASAEGQARAQAEHRELLRLCAAGQAARAAQLLRGHVLHVAKVLGRLLPD